MVAIRTLSLALLLTGALAMPSPQDASPSSLPTAASSSPDVAASQLDQLSQYAYNVSTEDVSSSATKRSDTCSRSNLRIRRNWANYTTTQKKSYINAVLCLQQLPAKTPNTTAPGAKSRYDDFVATHIQQTLTIHYTVCPSKPLAPNSLLTVEGNFPGLAPLLHLPV
jgi:tyrosinase